MTNKSTFIALIAISVELNYYYVGKQYCHRPISIAFICFIKCKTTMPPNLTIRPDINTEKHRVKVFSVDKSKPYSFGGY